MAGNDWNSWKLQKMLGMARHGCTLLGIAGRAGTTKNYWKFGDLGEDKNLVKYFQAFLDRRDALEDKDRTQR